MYLTNCTKKYIFLIIESKGYEFYRNRSSDRNDGRSNGDNGSNVASSDRNKCDDRTTVGGRDSSHQRFRGGAMNTVNRWSQRPLDVWETLHSSFDVTAPSSDSINTTSNHQSSATGERPSNKVGICHSYGDAVGGKRELMRSNAWEQFGHKTLARLALVTKLHCYAGKKESSLENCIALCKLARLESGEAPGTSLSMLMATLESHQHYKNTTFENKNETKNSSMSMHKASITTLLRIRKLYPIVGAPVGWVRNLCVALHKRSVFKGELRRASAIGSMLLSLSLPSGECDVVNNASKYVEACYCAVQIMIKRGQYERAVFVIEQLLPLCAKNGLHKQNVHIRFHTSFQISIVFVTLCT